MVDICMCSGSDCDKRDSCFRFMAIADEYQSFFDGTPDEDGNCDYYWELNDTDDIEAMSEVMT